MSLIRSASESLKQSNRRIMVVGPRGSGKTTFSVSASKHAGDTIAGGHRVCDDVLLIEGDSEGVMGAMDAGLEPARILGMTDCDTWDAYQKRLVLGLRELQTPLTDGTIKVVIIDLSWPAKLIDRSIDPNNQKDWKLVANEGARLFRALAGLKGVTVIGNAQIKASSSPGETTQAVDASAAKAIGGERSTFTIDLPKGIAALWLDNCSFIFCREVKRVKDPSGAQQRRFSTHTTSSNKFEAKSRAGSKLLPLEPGDKSLHALLKQAYGEAL